MVMDLVRLRTEELTARYVQTLGHDYVERGLPDFFEDFRNSMYAAWTANELFSSIPRDSRRIWCHIVPRALPTVQVILGLPVGRKEPFCVPVFRGCPARTLCPRKLAANGECCGCRCGSPCADSFRLAELLDSTKTSVARPRRRSLTAPDRGVQLLANSVGSRPAIRPESPPAACRLTQEAPFQKLFLLCRQCRRTPTHAARPLQPINSSGSLRPANPVRGKATN